MSLAIFPKLPLGGFDRRRLVEEMTAGGLLAARSKLDRDREMLRPLGVQLADDEAVIVLGGSNGLTRALVLQLVFAENVRVVVVHCDRKRLQIGHFHAQAISEAALREDRRAEFWNADATDPETIANVVGRLRGSTRLVHLINGIALGAPKRYAEFGSTFVKEIDVAFHPLLQTPDFTKLENIRTLGLVQVEVATALDIERTIRFMGTSTALWANALNEASLLAPGRSAVAFCDYDFPPDDPVYARGPLASAKMMQRQSLDAIQARCGARTLRVCFPPVPTTALGAIPGGLLTYALSAQILLERNQWKGTLALGAAAAELLRHSTGEDLRFDESYRRCLPEYNERLARIEAEDSPAAFHLLPTAHGCEDS